MEKPEFLGRDWAFPITFHKGAGGPAMAEGKESVAQSLAILFNCGKGERPYRPDYGADLSAYLFDPLSKARESEVKRLVEQAILLFEPRVKLLGVKLQVEELKGQFFIEITYLIRNTNTRQNQVLPF